SDTRGGVEGRGRLSAVILSVAIVVIMSIVAAGCTKAAGGDKAGGSGEPVSLRLGTSDPKGRPASDDIEQVASQGAKLSGGSVRIDIAWEAQGHGVARPDQRVAEMVRAGTLDAALVPARAWDKEGVTD